MPSKPSQWVSPLSNHRRFSTCNLFYPKRALKIICKSTLCLHRTLKDWPHKNKTALSRAGCQCWWIKILRAPRLEPLKTSELHKVTQMKALRQPRSLCSYHSRKHLQPKVSKDSKKSCPSAINLSVTQIIIAFQLSLPQKPARWPCPRKRVGPRLKSLYQNLCQPQGRALQPTRVLPPRMTPLIRPRPSWRTTSSPSESHTAALSVMMISWVDL